MSPTIEVLYIQFLNSLLITSWCGWWHSFLQMRKILRLSLGKTSWLLRDVTGIWGQVCLVTQARSSIHLLVLLLQVSVSRPMGQVECEVLIEQWAKVQVELLGILGWFQGGGGRGNCRWPTDFRSLIGDSVASKEAEVYLFCILLYG